MDDYRLRKAAVLQGLAASLGKGEESLHRIETRLHLSYRQGFPDGANQGRGYRGGFDFDQFFSTLLLFQLLRFDFTLSPAVIAVKAAWPIARTAVTHTVAKREHFKGKQFFWLGEPPRHDDFRKGPGADPSSRAPNITTLALDPNDPEDAMQNVADRQLGFACAWFVNAQAVFEDVRNAWKSPDLQIDQEQLGKALLSWGLAD
jgi:hypothetical protein